MSLHTDKQTLDDLNIFDNKGKNSIYQLFNATVTSRGAELLEQWFRGPLSEEILINERSQIICFFVSINAAFPFDGSLCDFVEDYIETDDRIVYSAHDNNLMRILNNFIGGHDHDYKVIQRGVTAFVEIILSIRNFVAGLSAYGSLTPFDSELKHINLLLSDPEFAFFNKEKRKVKLSYAKVVAFDKQIRFKSREKIRKILDCIYRFDVYIAAAVVAKKYKLNFPKAVPRDFHQLNLKKCYHPLLKNAVGYQLNINPAKNIVFLTGANMAGKSTFMKSLGIALYLAHMGFPVPAEEMEFSVMDGLYSTINLPDNLSMGYSHFYGEVLRIKKIARELSTGKNLFVIFDELFRGTNVKDAYDATIALTDAFSEKNNCKFVISTHIVEAGEILKARRDNISFLYLPTIMVGTKPVYTYKLKQGITEDRHGMIIINNEKILEMLDSSAQPIKNALS